MTPQDIVLQLSRLISCHWIKAISGELVWVTIVRLSLSHLKAIHTQVRLPHEVLGSFRARRTYVIVTHAVVNRSWPIPRYRLPLYICNSYQMGGCVYG